MKRLLTRLATVLAVAPIAFAGLGGTASAIDVTVPGCYGAEGTFVCDPTISFGVPAGVELYEDTIEVCVSICTTIPVTLARTTSGDPVAVCITYENRSGVPTSRCVTLPDVLEIVDDLRDTVDETVDDVNEMLEIVDTARDMLGEAIRELAYTYCYGQDAIRCNTTVYNALRTVAGLVD